MARRKLNSIFPIPNEPKAEVEPKPYAPNFIPERPLTNKLSHMQAPDSLQRFQWELESSLIHHREMRVNSYQQQRKNKRRVQTEYNPDSQGEEELERVSANKMFKLQKEVEELKGEIHSSKSNGLEDKLDKLLQEMVRNRDADRQLYKQQRNSQPPNNIFYPPMPMYPPNPYDSQKPREKYDRTSSTFQPKQRNPRNRSAKRLLRKYFFAVLFTKFLKKQAQALAKARKQNLRKFFVEKFDPQILNLKNWLVECHGFAFPVILEKQDINLEFWSEKREAIEREKQGLLLNLVKLGLEKMKKDCTSQKISFFSEILHNLCMRGSFCMSRFWSAFEMESICVSEFYGCIRADESLQKFMIGMVVFIKVLIFNMLLQPHKFDQVNFPKSKKMLTKNMYIISSTYYKLAKEVLKEYLETNRPQYFRLGNWLDLKEEFIVECCEPLKFNCDYPEQGEYISGLVGNELEILQMRNEWGGLKQKIQQIIVILHRQLAKRRRDTVRGQKFKLYN